MKRVLFAVSTKGGSVRIPAWYVGNGLYIHRLITTGNVLSKNNNWTISCELGYSIISLFEVKFSVVREAAKFLQGKIWDKEHLTEQTKEYYRKILEDRLIPWLKEKQILFR